jgi:hypothetical protein
VRTFLAKLEADTDIDHHMKLTTVHMKLYLLGSRSNSKVRTVYSAAEMLSKHTFLVVFRTSLSSPIPNAFPYR